MNSKVSHILRSVLFDVSQAECVWLFLCVYACVCVVLTYFCSTVNVFNGENRSKTIQKNLRQRRYELRRCYQNIYTVTPAGERDMKAPLRDNRVKLLNKCILKKMYALRISCVVSTVFSRKKRCFSVFEWKSANLELMMDKDLSAWVSQESVRASTSALSCSQASLLAGPSRPLTQQIKCLA